MTASARTLRREWLTATLFNIAIWAIAVSGMLLLGVGVLFTIPWALLATTAQYRRSFARGGKPRATVVEDPHAAAIGIPESERSIPQAPIGAWVLMTCGIVAPVALIAFGIAVLARV